MAEIRVKEKKRSFIPLIIIFIVIALIIWAIYEFILNKNTANSGQTFISALRFANFC